MLDLVIVLAAIAYRHRRLPQRRGRRDVLAGRLLRRRGRSGAQLAAPLGSRLARRAGAGAGRDHLRADVRDVRPAARRVGRRATCAAGSVWRAAQAFDAGIGAVLGVVSVLLVAWMVAVPLASSPYPSLAAAGQPLVDRAQRSTRPCRTRCATCTAACATSSNRSGFPPVFGDLPSTTRIVRASPTRSARCPLPRGRRRGRRTARSSRSTAQAPSCDRGIEGSGFVYAPHTC